MTAKSAVARFRDDKAQQKPRLSQAASEKRVGDFSP
jgi:hypothetical protein